MILLSGPEKIVQQFERFDAQVVFSAEGFCWPDEGLASKYPAVQRGKRYLNSGGMGTISRKMFVFSLILQVSLLHIMSSGICCLFFLSAQFCWKLCRLILFGTVFDDIRTNLCIIHVRNFFTKYQNFSQKIAIGSIALENDQWF